jgi:hypothetical protein
MQFSEAIIHYQTLDENMAAAYNKRFSDMQW